MILFIYIDILAPAFKSYYQWTKLIKLLITWIFIILNEHISFILFQGQGVISNASSRLAKAKLRLLFEAAPIALIIEASGGSSCVCATETFEHIGALNSPISVYEDIWIYSCRDFTNISLLTLLELYLIMILQPTIQICFPTIAFFVNR